MRGTATRNGSVLLRCFVLLLRCCGNARLAVSRSRWVGRGIADPRRHRRRGGTTRTEQWRSLRHNAAATGSAAVGGASSSASAWAPARPQSRPWYPTKTDFTPTVTGSDHQQHRCSLSAGHPDSGPTRRGRCLRVVVAAAGPRRVVVVTAGSGDGGTSGAPTRRPRPG